MERRSMPGKMTVKEGSRTIHGYAVVFNSLSEVMWDFVERIEPTAFDELLKAPVDCRALFNHVPSQILGRTTSGTLRLKRDDHGLWYEVDLPNTMIGNDVFELVQREDINQSSFGFDVKTDKRVMENGQLTRVIQVVSRLYDVSPVTFPAYPETTVEVRSWAGQGNRINHDVKRRMLDLIEREEE